MPILKDEKVPVSQCSAESNCSRHINSLQHIGIEKSNGVCSPALNRSFDSGIVMDDNSLYLHKQIQQCKIILSVLERDKELYKNLRIRLSKIAENRKRKQFLNKVICHICSTDIDINNTESNVRCNYCHMVVCTTKNCAELKAKISGWECKQCSASKESLENTSSWVAEQLLFKERIHLHPMRARSEIYIPINNDGDNDTFMQFESVSQVDLPSYLNFMNEDQKIKIRKYVEELISQILGLPLSRVQLGQISKSEEYLPVINSRKINARTQNDKNNENFEISQERLQQLIETVIAQTLNSSSSNITSDKSQKNLIDNSTQNDIISENGIQSGTASKTYEELLSKAIMNKIATSKNLDCLSVVNTLNIDINSNIENQSTTSGSSLEPKTESSLTDNELDFTNDDLENLSSELKTNLSKYVAAHTIALPDILMEPSESEDDDYTSVCSTNIGEGNWLFKKKRCSVNAGSSCATILVPDPKEHVSAQIGDKTADEISDLSELGSDTDNSIELFQSDLYANNRLLNKHVIGGQNTTAWFEESPDTTSHISFTSASQDDLHFNETVNKTFRQQYVHPTEVVNTDIILSQKDNVPFTGSIAEREFKKWNNAVEMPNNPYAPDALKRRISGSQERFIDIPNISPSTEQNAIDLIKKDTETPDTITKEDEIFEKYSRDYYINKTNQAKQCEKDITPIGEQVDETTIINEVIPNGNKCRRLDNKFDNCDWKLSVPVRRSSSVKLNFTSKSRRKTSAILQQPRPLTSASNYGENEYENGIELRSEHGWRSSSSNIHSVNSRKSSSISSLASRKSLAVDSNILSQFEKQLLHKDMKRNSFRAVSSMSDDFVVNPVFSRDKFLANGSQMSKLSIRTDIDDQVDSGVDSYLNDFNEMKSSNNSLLF